MLDLAGWLFTHTHTHTHTQIKAQKIKKQKPHLLGILHWQADSFHHLGSPGSQRQLATKLKFEPRPPDNKFTTFV